MNPVAPISFSVFIPVYNGMPYLKESVESVLKQSYSHYEIHILDSGSTDDGILWLENCQFPQVKIHRTDKRLSIEENWNRILAIPKKAYMTILGQDDRLLPNFLEEMAASILLKPEAQLYFSHFNLINEHGSVIRKCAEMPSTEDAIAFLTERLLIKRDSFATGYVFSSEKYDALGGIPLYPDLLFADDALWLLLMGQKGHMHINPLITFDYRFHQGSTSGTPRQERLFTAAELHFKHALSMFKDEPRLSTEILPAAPTQIIPLCSGYLGLTLLSFSLKGEKVPSSYSTRVVAFLEQFHLSAKKVFGMPRTRMLVQINNSFLRKELAKLLLKLFPSIKHKLR